jgi:hypothetical protein
MSGFCKCVVILLGCIALAGCIFTASLVALQREVHRQEIEQRQQLYDYELGLMLNAAGELDKANKYWEEWKKINVIDSRTGELKDDLDSYTLMTIDRVERIKAQNEEEIVDWRRKLDRMEQELIADKTSETN